MKRERNDGFVLILGLIIVIIGIIAFFVYRTEKRKSFDKLLNNEMYLEVDLGVIKRERVLQEKNALLRRINKENNTYLYITKNNIIFSYYYDWYYVIDPMQGIHKDYEKQLKADTVQKILDEIKEKSIDSLKYKVENDYAVITIDDKIQYIEKIELQYILQDNDVELPIFGISPEKPKSTEEL
jgi:cbb3-type cytochrome oxidase subunit 3